jgi:hypothetical protein
LSLGSWEEQLEELVELVELVLAVWGADHDLPLCNGECDCDGDAVCAGEENGMMDDEGSRN